MSAAVGLAVVLATVFAAGTSVARVLGIRGGTVPRLARAYLLGLGSLALQAFGYGLLGWRLELWGWLGPWWLLFPVIQVWSRARRCPGDDPAPRPQRADRVTGFIVLCLGAVSLAVALSRPIHTADAANIYGLNGRQIATHGVFSAESLRELHTAGHIEYPPLIALSESLVFMAAGQAGFRLVLVLFVLFFLAYAVLVHELVRERISGWWGAGCTLLVVLSPEILLYASRGYADLPLTAYLAAALWHGLRVGRTGSMAEARASAVFLVLAALTKNEGLALAVPGGIALCGALVLGRRPAGALRLAAGLALGLLSWPVYRAAHGLTLVDLQGARPGTLIEGAERLGMITREIFAVMARRGLGGDFMWGGFWPCLGAVVAVAVLVAVVRDARELLTLIVHAVPLLGQLAIYALVLAMTATDLRWHLQTALPRMMLHVTPAGIVLLAVACRTVLGPRGQPPASAAVSGRE